MSIYNNLVLKMKGKRRYRRGYAVAVLVAFEGCHAILWRIFSRVAKRSVRLELKGKRTDDKALYNFHESVVDALKSVLKEGVRTIAITAPVRTTYPQEFLDHVKKHHRYLIQSKSTNHAIFVKLVGSAVDRNKVAELTKSKEFTELIAETASEEADQVVNNLEKHLYGANNNAIVLYSLREIENFVYSLKKDRESKTEHLLLTDRYLDECRQKNSINRLLQIAKNNEVKTRVVNAETIAGNRISQFGGIVFFSLTDKQCF
jgi:stalled ribosome rescue protein Dom34